MAPLMHCHGHVCPLVVDSELFGRGLPTNAQLEHVVIPVSNCRVAVDMGQSEQSDTEVSPVDTENVPVGQLEHLVAPPP